MFHLLATSLSPQPPPQLTTCYSTTNKSRITNTGKYNNRSLRHGMLLFCESASSNAITLRSRLQCASLPISWESSSHLILPCLVVKSHSPPSQLIASIYEYQSRNFFRLFTIYKLNQTWHKDVSAGLVPPELVFLFSRLHLYRPTQDPGPRLTFDK